MSSAKAENPVPPLLDILRAQIAQEGPIPLDVFMRVCMQHPDHGYWQRAATVGAAGDFITAPEISQVFGELVGLWAAVVWESMGRPSRLRLVELGPGRGALMRDALRAAHALPPFFAAANVHLVEASGPLRKVQQQALAGTHPALAWHNSLAEVPAGPAIIIGNEFLDALPIRQVIYWDKAWHERVIALTPDGKLQFAVGPVLRVQGEAQPQQGAIIELRPDEDDLLAALAARADPLACLFIDYGPSEPTFGDTLQAVQRHAYIDPLATPGTADLTSHVQFGVLARKARAAGLAVYGPISQADLLGRLGIVSRTQALMASNPTKAGEVETAVQRLISPTGMGSLFKALAIASPNLPPPPAFG